MAHGKRVTLVSLSFFCVYGTNEAKRGLMRTPVSKSLNILYFILTFTSEIFYYSLNFKKLWM